MFMLYQVEGERRLRGPPGGVDSGVDPPSDPPSKAYILANPGETSDVHAIWVVRSVFCSAGGSSSGMVDGESRRPQRERREEII